MIRRGNCKTAALTGCALFLCIFAGTAWGCGGEEDISAALTGGKGRYELDLGALPAEAGRAAGTADSVQGAAPAAETGQAVVLQYETGDAGCGQLPAGRSVENDPLDAAGGYAAALGNRVTGGCAVQAGML